VIATDRILPPHDFSANPEQLPNSASFALESDLRKCRATFLLQFRRPFLRRADAALPRLAGNALSEATPNRKTPSLNGDIHDEYLGRRIIERLSCTDVWRIGAVDHEFVVAGSGPGTVLPPRHCSRRHHNSPTPYLPRVQSARAEPYRRGERVSAKASQPRKFPPGR